MYRNSKFSLFLVFALLITTMIPQGVNAETWTSHKPTDAKYKESRLAKVFNKFRYDMSVEWDQNDPYFKQNAEKELEISLLSLKSEGITEKDILSYMEKSLLDQKTLNEYRKMMSAMKKQGLSDEQASVQAQKFMEKSIAQGASFGGSGGGRGGSFVVIAVIIVVVVTVIVLGHGKKPDHDNGDNGDNGDDGYNGNDGHNGHNGYNGNNGYNGHNGHNGNNGYNGHNGNNGYNGYNGHGGYEDDCA